MPSEHNPQRNLIIAILVLSCFFVIHTLIVQNISNQPLSDAKTPAGFKKLPDFSAISDTRARKKAFFEFLRPLVEAENERLRKLRHSLPSMPESKLKKLAASYDLDITMATPHLRIELQGHIDTLPTSLVLAQAAIESAWGTSRFAQEGNNLFGEWCFRKGCGLVPKSRNAEAQHEVRRFASAADSIRSYMKNLNTHRAYRDLRAQRMLQHEQQQAYSGCFLATGLTSYSQKGHAYVEMVKSLIRGNRLESGAGGYCKPVVIAKPAASELGKESNLAHTKKDDAKDPDAKKNNNLPDDLPKDKTDTARAEPQEPEPKQPDKYNL
ncbi:MAG: glucosaminidase domain-containing protein [Pseudomonadales bacterium]|nr:glucosaminidase domain-containing protein [Pseudomonadales bacterium]